MEIECPGCGKYNKFDCGYVDCAECKTRLSGHRYQKTTGIIGSAVGLGVLVATVHFADEALSPRRHPLATEYAIVTECINGHPRLVDGPTLRQITFLCTCAVEKASSVTPAASLLKKPSAFADRMRSALAECRRSGG